MKPLTYYILPAATLGLALLLLAGAAPQSLEAQDCMECVTFTCPSGYHKINDTPDDEHWRSAEEHGCEWGDCSSHHDRCFYEEEDAQLVDRLEELPPEELGRLMQRYPDRIVLNASRAAVQVLDCTTGTAVVAHFPLASHDQYHALVSLLQD